MSLMTFISLCQSASMSVDMTFNMLGFFPFFFLQITVISGLAYDITGRKNKPFHVCLGFTFNFILQLISLTEIHEYA